MKRQVFSSILRGMALSALTNMAMPVAEAWAAEETQVLRRAEPTAVRGVVPFTTFQQEELALAQSLPCKWISKDGRLGPSYGNVRYDFLCKGGDFATVSLYMDKAGTAGDGVGKVRLLYRDWPVNVNPNAGEALVAQQFLQHVAGRFVPAAVAGEVMDAFWANQSRNWAQDGVAIRFEVEKPKGQQFSIRRLEIAGTGPGLQTQQPYVPAAAGLAKSAPKPVDTGVRILGPDGKPLVEKPVPVTPKDGGLSKAAEAPPAIPAPEAVKILPMPGAAVVKPVEVLVVPDNAPASSDEKVLEKATPAELNTAPAPESKVTPVAPPELSATLVPSTADLVGGRQKAPSNFDVYNKAVELTKSVEDRAQIAKVEQAKVTASKPVSGTVKVTPTQVVTPSTVAVPPLKAVPTPGATEGEGLGTKTLPPVEEVPLPVNYNGPRSTEVRPLPQLRFVPKAEPLNRGDEVIKFEDEGSRL